MKGVVLLGGVLPGLALSAWAEECTLVSQEKFSFDAGGTDPKDLLACQCVGEKTSELWKIRSSSRQRQPFALQLG